MSNAKRITVTLTEDQLSFLIQLVENYVNLVDPKMTKEIAFAKRTHTDLFLTREQRVNVT